MLKTKCILAPFEDSDGLRISVMSRHTLNDGVTPDPRITSALYHYWLPCLAPPAHLLGNYYRRGLPWEAFERSYRHHLEGRASGMVQAVAKASLEGIITLMCIEETPYHCHRRLLVEECLRYQPSLSVDIK